MFLLFVLVFRQIVTSNKSFIELSENFMDDDLFLFYQRRCCEAYSTRKQIRKEYKNR